jgi:hypothetical protein
MSINEYSPRQEIKSPVSSRLFHHLPRPPRGVPRLAAPFLPLGSPRIFLAWRETGGDATFATLRCRGRGLPASADEMLAATNKAHQQL